MPESHCFQPAEPTAQATTPCVPEPVIERIPGLDYSWPPPLPLEELPRRHPAFKRHRGIAVAEPEWDPHRNPIAMDPDATIRYIACLVRAVQSKDLQRRRGGKEREAGLFPGRTRARRRAEFAWRPAPPEPALARVHAESQPTEADWTQARTFLADPYWTEDLEGKRLGRPLFWPMPMSPTRQRQRMRLIDGIFFGRRAPDRETKLNAKADAIGRREQPRRLTFPVVAPVKLAVESQATAEPAAWRPEALEHDWRGVDESLLCLKRNALAPRKNCMCSRCVRAREQRPTAPRK
jgi:hypothetical protein